MTTVEWLEKAKAHKDVLRSLVDEYHPGSCRPRPDVIITAPGSEAACSRIREEIRSQEADLESPVVRFDKALEGGDALTLNSLLNSAWFGVPESTGCWGIEGFREAVLLMEDPPEQEAEQE